jgi:hypothetical protein
MNNHPIRERHAASREQLQKALSEIRAGLDENLADTLARCEQLEESLREARAEGKAAADTLAEKERHWAGVFVLLPHSRVRPWYWYWYWYWYGLARGVLGWVRHSTQPCLSYCSALGAFVQRPTPHLT